MEIIIARATGSGTTELGAFDNALEAMGTTNYNLVRLSSVIPPNTVIRHDKKHLANKEDFGKRLYCVYAEARSSMPGTAIGSIMGYYQFDDNRGLFVEHELIGSDEKSVKESLINLTMDSLSDLCRTRHYSFNPDDFKYIYEVATVSELPSCTLVMGIYKVEPW